ncbi:MAG: metallophosphoesterase family protein [Planctomycetota bacterium]
MKSFRLAAAITLLVSLTAVAHEKPASVVDAGHLYAPSVLPDRVILTLSGDSAHTQDVSWRTNSTVEQAFVEYAVATGGPYFVKNAARIPATTNPFRSDLGPCHLHTARMGGLTPATRYVYRVGDGKNWSEWFQFSTASEDATPFRFIYFGDAQNDLRSMWSRVIREAQADAPHASFMLHAGDLVNRANRDAEWGEWFGGGGWLNAMMPSLATPGNHEYSRLGGIGPKQLSTHWQPTFAFPENGPEGNEALRETVYWIDYQGVRFISLNSNEQQEAQVPWLEQVLANNPCRWTILTFHHPIYSTASGRDNARIRELWKPLIDKYRVDLVLQGHDHSYGRTGLDVPENLDNGMRMQKQGTVYVVSVSGPKQYSLDRRELFQRAGSGVQLYQIIDIDGDRLTYRAHLANGTLYDGFELIKQPGEANQLIEQIPSTPEARKPQP